MTIRAANECRHCGKLAEADEHGITSFWGGLCVSCARAAGIDTTKTRPTSEFFPPSQAHRSRVFKGFYVDACVDALMRGERL